MNSPALKRLLGILAAPEERGFVPQVSSLGRFLVKGSYSGLRVPAGSFQVLLKRSGAIRVWSGFGS